MNTFKKRWMKIWGIIFFSVACYIILHNVSNEVDFQRYSNIFVGFIKAYLNGHFTLDYFNIFSLFNSNITVDPSLPSRTQGIMRSESFFVFDVYLFVITHLITNINPELLIVLPIGIIFIPVSFLAVIRAYIPLNNKSNVVFCTLLAIYYLLFTASTKEFGSFYIGPPSVLLFLLTLLCIHKSFYSAPKKGIYCVIISIFYISLALYWHTMLMISLFFTVSISSVLGFFYIYSLISKNNNSQRKQFINLSLLITVTSIVCSLTFTHLWQSSYLNKFVTEASLWEFISDAIIKFKGGLPFATPYSFNYKNLFFGELYFKSLLLIYFFAFLLLIIPIILNIYYLKTQDRNIGMPFIFAISIFVAQIIIVIAYYKTNSLSFIYVPIYFTFFGIQLFVNTIKKEDSFYQITRLFILSSLVILIVLSLICTFSLGIVKEGGETSITKYIDTESNFNWLYTHIDYINNKIIVDFNILGKYFQREASKPEIKIDYVDLDVSSFSYFVGDTNYLPSFLSKSYLVIDRATMEKGLAINVNSNRGLIHSDFKKLNNCIHQHEIYNDGYITIFKVRESVKTGE